MSKAAQKKRAAERAAGKRGRFGSWSQRSLLDLLTAAACSPGSFHRLPSIGRALQDVVRLHSTGADAITPDSLADLLDATTRHDPRVTYLEDYVPLDPLLQVRVRHRGRRYRLHPAGLERPVAAIARTQRVADAVDETLLKLEGFGIADLLELVLRYVDGWIGVCGPSWPAHAADDYDAPASITADEIAAIRGVPSIQDVAEDCADPDRARRALVWGTVDAANLRFEPDGDTSFGSTIAVRLPSGELWAMPPSLQVEALFGAVNALAERAGASLDSEACEERFHEISVRLTLRCLGLPTDLTSRDAASGSFSGIFPMGGRHWLALDMISSLTLRSLNELAQPAAKRIDSARPGLRCTSASGGETRLPSDAIVARLLVTSSPGHIGAMQGPSKIARMSLDDLEWAAASADDPDDVFLFVRDFADPPNVGQLMVLETINAWEFWRQNGKAFHRAGSPYHLMVATPHEGKVEWTTASELEDVEEALFSLDLPELRTWTKLTLDDRRVRLLSQDSLEGWILGRGERGIAVRLFTGTVPVLHRGFLDSVGEAVLWTIERIAAHGLFLGGKPFKILLEHDPLMTNPPLRYSGSPSSDEFTISWSGDLWNLEAETPGTVERLLRNALAVGLGAISKLDARAFAELSQAIASAPSALSMETETMRQRRVDLPKPQQPHAAYLSGTRRALAVHMRTQAVRVGEHAADAAVRLESDVIYPFLKDTLLGACSRFDGDALVTILACELECAAYRRVLNRKSLQSSIRKIKLEYDPVQRATENDQVDGAAERRLELLLELALAHPPTGRSSPDHLELRHLLSVAQLCIDSGVRGEAAHYRLVSTVTKISDMFEVTSEQGPESMVNWLAFHREGYEDVVRHFADRDGAPDAPKENGAKAQRAPSDRFKAIDDAMRAAYGFSAVSLIGVLHALTSWPVSGQLPIARASLAEAIAYVEEVRGAPASEIRAAVEALVLRGADLRASDIEPWEFAKRPARLITRPLIQVSETEVLILPWFLEKSLSIYQRYLADCRLPWPRAATHPIVLTALEQYRQWMNEALEDEAADVLERHGLKVRKRVKKPQVLGLASLSGEIDCVAIDEQRGMIWVLEVKDPEEVFSAADISRSIRRFYEPKGWLDKLAAKVTEVERAPMNVAQALGARGDSWLVRAAVVTRRPVPAGHRHERRFQFTTIERLISFVSEPAQPVVVE